jgi:hypothetical protein
VGRDVGDGPGPGQPVRAVDPDIVLVPEHRHGDLAGLALVRPVRGWRPLAIPLQGPARIPVDLRPPYRRPVGRRLAAADRRLLFRRQLDRAGLHHGGIDDLAAHRQHAPAPARQNRAVETAAQRAGTGQLLAEQPDRLGVRHRLVQAEADEAHEREAVAELVFGMLVREAWKAERTGTDLKAAA